MLHLAKRLLVEEEGQGMVEYGLILALVSVVVVGVLALIGTQLNTHFTTILEELGGSAPS